MGSLRYLLGFSDKFLMAVSLWPFASAVLTLPILARLYHRDGRLRFWSAASAYAIVLYALGLACFTLYPLPSGTSGPGITYGVAPQLNPLGFIGDIRAAGMLAVFQDVANIAFFVPLGFIARRALGVRLRWALAAGLVVSLLIETAQLTGFFRMYPYAYRCFDVNDLMWNTGGSACGWLCARLLDWVFPRASREADPVTARPSFVRRMVAFCLDTLLIAVLSLIGAAAVALAARVAGRPDALPWFAPVVVVGAVFLAVELVVPVMNEGRTPGGGFVRMTCETRPRTGLRRALFYLLRTLTWVAAYAFAPIAWPILGIFYLVRRQMPYDLLAASSDA